jgi:hypothetical protein
LAERIENIYSCPDSSKLRHDSNINILEVFVTILQMQLRLNWPPFVALSKFIAKMPSGGGRIFFLSLGKILV